MNTENIREHMEVCGNDGQHVGVVDAIEGDRIKLTRNDPQAGGEHQYVPVIRVARVEDRVILDRPAEEILQALH